MTAPHDPLDDIQADPWALWLSGRTRTALELPHYRRAAVLVALTREADPRVLLTVRSSELPTHKGQIAFPGGSLDAGRRPPRPPCAKLRKKSPLTPPP